MRSLLTALVSGALLVLSALPAAATTIYFAGGEDTSFTFNGTVGVSAANGGTGSSNSFNNTFAREGVALGNSTTVADPPANRFTTPTFTSVSSLWIHAKFFSNNTANGTSGEQTLIIRSPDGVSRLLLRQTGTAGTLKASKRNAAGTITDLATASGTFSSQTLTPIDIQIVYGCTSGDVFQVYLAGTSVINFTGSSICTDAATQLNQVDFAAVNNAGTATNCSAAQLDTCWSEIIISDSDTRSMALWTLAPQAAGNTQSWTPNTVGNVNPITINDVNFVSSSSSSQLSEWTTPTSVPTGTWNLLAIVQEARVETSSTGPQTFEWLVRTKDGTDHVTGSVTPTVGAFANFNNQIWATNPHTSAAWAISDIASGFNLGIESTP